MVVPQEALANNSRPLLRLRQALQDGTVARVLSQDARPKPAMPPRQMRQVTPGVRDALVADYSSGLGIYEITRKHGLHRYTIATHLTAAGVVMRRVISDEERRQAAELYEQGDSLNEIGRRLGRDPQTIKRIIRATSGTSVTSHSSQDL